MTDLRDRSCLLQPIESLLRMPRRSLSVNILNREFDLQLPERVLMNPLIFYCDWGYPRFAAIP